MLLLRRCLSVWLVMSLLLAFRQERAVDVPDEHRFRKITLSDPLPDLVDMDIAPNGDVYFIALDGTIRVWRARQNAVQPVGKLAVTSASEAKLQAIALHPDFEQNRHVFLYYAPAGSGLTRRDTTNVLARFTLRNDTLDRITLDRASETVLLRVNDNWKCCHSGGGMAFDGRGNLYLTTGDNTNPFGTNYAPADERPGRQQYDAQRTSANTQDLRGKILRIHPEPDGTYAIPEGNLFADPRDGRPEIYIMGCRNPFRVTVDPATNALFWSEIGPDASDNHPHGPRGYDELNRATAAGNHGWPYFVGNNEAYAKVDFARDTVLYRHNPQRPLNTSPNNTGLQTLPPARPALLWYPYDKSDTWPNLGAGGRTLVAGPVYAYDAQNPSRIKFPAYFDGRLFLAEWMRNWLKTVSFGAPDNRAAGAVADVADFMPSTRFAKPISLKFGPDGALYVLEFGTLWGGNTDSRLVRIEYVAGNRPPVARLSIGTDAGAAPLRTTLSARASHDYDRTDRLTYRWSINGRPLPQRAAELTHTFAQPGTYRVNVVVTDAHGARSAATQTVRVGNAPPRVRIALNHPTGLLASRSTTYQVDVVDAEDGSLVGGRIPPGRVQVRLSYVPTSRYVAQRPDAPALSPYYRGATWIEESDCKGCHALDARSVGPSFRAIAERYQGQRSAPTLVTTLSQKILQGGGGVWGEQAMSAHPQLSAEVSAEMVRYILSLTDPNLNRPVPARGQFATELDQPGTYILTASYTDKGTQTARPITRYVTSVLRSPVFRASDFDDSYEIQQLETLNDIRKDGYVVARRLDLTGVGELRFTARTYREGTSIEARTDSATGPLLGRVDVPLTTDGTLWRELRLPITAVQGEKDLFLVFKNRLYVLNLLEVKEMRLVSPPALR